MIQEAHEQVIRTERAYKAAVEALSNAQAEVFAIEGRLDQESAARATVVGAAQAGKLDEQMAALRLAVIDADACDLSALRAEALPRVEAATAQVELTERALRMQRDYLANLERQEVVGALDAAIATLQAKLYTAIVEKQRAMGKVGTFYGVWKLSLDLENAHISTK